MNSVFIKESLKLKLAAFALNFFLVVGLLFIPTSEALPHMPAWLNHLDVLLTFIFCIPLVWQLYLFTKKTGITLSTNGIEENLSKMKSQQFSWNEIVGLKFLKIFFLKYLLIYIRDPHAYLKSQNKWTRLKYLGDLKKFGTPVKIPIHTLDKSPQEIAQILSKYVEQLRPGLKT